MSYSRNSLFSTDTSENKLLSLPYKSFDQEPENGWRVLADNGLHNEAADLIIKYLSKHKNNLKPDQITNLYWHAGQMFAFSGAKNEATEYFKKSCIENEPKDSPIKWNDYACATIAFLERDEKTLLACREKIATSCGFEMNGVKIIPNLEIVDNMINHFDLEYSEVYQIQINDPRSSVKKP